MAREFGTMDRFMAWGRGAGAGPFGDHLRSLWLGFGSETRDSVLLYAASFPVFVADSYARGLLSVLGVPGKIKYDACQGIFEEGITREFPRRELAMIAREYTPAELAHALPHSPRGVDVPRVLLYQQFHAGIDELGISGRWDAFGEELRRRTRRTAGEW